VSISGLDAASLTKQLQMNSLAFSDMSFHISSPKLISFVNVFSCIYCTVGAAKRYAPLNNKYVMTPMAQMSTF